MHYKLKKYTISAIEKCWGVFDDTFVLTSP